MKFDNTTVDLIVRILQTIVTEIENLIKMLKKITH